MAPPSLRCPRFCSHFVQHRVTTTLWFGVGYAAIKHLIGNLTEPRLLGALAALSPPAEDGSGDQKPPEGES